MFVRMYQEVLDRTKMYFLLLMARDGVQYVCLYSYVLREYSL